MKRIHMSCGGIQTGLLHGIGALALALYPLSSWGYIGPGLGTGVVATVLGVVVGLLMLAIGVVWYPLKRLIRRLRTKKSQ